MNLSVSESGYLYYNKRSGAILEPGSIIANLDLDDTSRIHCVKKFTGRFKDEKPGSLLPFVENQSNKIYNNCRTFLDNIFAGFCLPDPLFQPKMNEAIEKIMVVLKDPSLPLLELQDAMSSITGRIPIKVEKNIRKLMTVYAGSITSVLVQFPCQELERIINKHAATLQKLTDLEAFLQASKPIFQLIKNYENGIRGLKTKKLLS